MNLYEKIKQIYPTLSDVDFQLDGNIVLRNDGAGDYIARWSHPEFAQPTQEQLDAVTGV